MRLAPHLLLALLALFAMPLHAESAGPCERLVVYTRAGCPHCAAAREFLPQLLARHPALRIEEHDVVADAEARQRFFELSARHAIDRPGVPTFEACGRILVGFDRGQASAEALQALVDGGAQTPRKLTVRGLGELSVERLGLPGFTLAVGLVDGFNPCATWVLLFLLSLLVNVRSRARMAMVAGTFVVMSGVVYFAFMAAWLNLFLLLGASRLLQYVLGALALGMAVINIKDFLVPGRGPSLSIPAGLKPGLYARVREVINAERLGAALFGVAVLAILVNLAELLCTAGLPALYTHVLARHETSALGRYGYLLLYNLAYVADDALLVTLAVVTLRRLKLQERAGRWLKLLSGVLVGLLGVLLLFAPGMLLQL